MVALAILGLCTGLIFSNLGPWLAQGRASESQAAFWRALPGTELALSELAEGAVNPEDSTISADDARFSAYLPRLAPAPVAVELKIVSTHEGARLTLQSPALASASILLDRAPPLRFAAANRSLVLESEIQGAPEARWRPVAIAAFSANAPLICSFDPISRSCR